MQQPAFLPMTRSEMKILGWQELDILLITGDAYVDHPSFGAALVGRYLVSLGYRTGIVAQPDWRQPESVQTMGRPRLFAGVTAGAMDSMVANYTANKKLRRDDAYSPGGRYGLRPNRATLIYTNLVKHSFPGLPVVLGGIEASLRRLAHYDYWDNKLRRSLLLDAKADILIYGMAERPLAELAARLQRKEPWIGIPQTAVVLPQVPEGQVLTLPSFEALVADPAKLSAATLAEEAERDWRHGRMLAQVHANRVVVVYPPAEPLTTAMMDAVYSLPFQRQAHPLYTEKIPGLAPVENSVITHRGCFGGCTFCALGAHQGKIIQSRSPENILGELRRFKQRPSFHCTVTDLGGPSANMYGMRCQRPQGECNRASCLYPEICRYLETKPARHRQLLRQSSSLPGIKHVFVASGIRFDLALQDPEYIRALVEGGHVSGALKIAPEHMSSEVLVLMRKPGVPILERFVNRYRACCAAIDRPVILNAYFISAFPGSRRQDMEKIAIEAGRLGLRVEPMQDFIPLPMTIAGVMYFTGRNPWTQAPLPVEKSSSGRRQQRQALLNSSTAHPPAHRHRRSH